MAEHTTTTGTGSAPEQVHRVSEKFDSLQRSQNSTRWTSRLVAIAIALVAIIGVWIMLGPVIQAVRQPEDYQVALQEELETNLIPAMRAEGEDMFEALRPDIEKAVRQKLGERMPEFSSAIRNETQTLFTNLSTHAAGYQTRLSDLEQKIYQIVERHAPELTDEDQAAQLAQNANEAINVAVARVFQDRFEDEAQAAEEFGEQLRSFPVDQNLKGMSDNELREHMKQILAAYAAHHFDNTLSPELKTYAMNYED